MAISGWLKDAISDNAVLRRRIGAKYVCDIPRGSKLSIFEDRVVITHPEHEPFVIRNGTVKDITF